MLANLLRVSRLTLLYGETGAGKSWLLKNELMGLLHRRATDPLSADAPERPRVVVPFPERRDGGRFKGRREVAVLFDTWDADPLAGLRARIDQALGLDSAAGSRQLSLAEHLHRLAEQHDTRFLLVLDGFEAQLRVEPDDAHAAAHAQFATELADALNHPEPSAHFFIVVSDAARPLLEPWRSRVGGFGDRWLRIRHWQHESLSSRAAPAMVRPTTERPAHTPDPLPPARPSLTPSAASPSEALGIDLYLPLEPREPRPPSERVQALWDELLKPATQSAAMPLAVPAPREIATRRPDRPPSPKRSHSQPLPPPHTPPLPPVSWRTPWRIWSLLVVAIAALMILAWGASLQGPSPGDQLKPIASGVEPPRAR